MPEPLTDDQRSRLRALVKNDDLRIAASALRGSSWPQDMAQRMDERADRLTRAIDALPALLDEIDRLHLVNGVSTIGLNSVVKKLAEQEAKNEQLRTINQQLQDQRDGLVNLSRNADAEVEQLRNENAELNALFNLQQTRMTEAVSLWRFEDPEAREHKIPDLGNLLTYLLERIQNADAEGSDSYDYGYQDGHDDSYDHGYQNGYDDGFEDGCDQGRKEAADEAEAEADNPSLYTAQLSLANYNREQTGRITHE